MAVLVGWHLATVVGYLAWMSGLSRDADPKEGAFSDHDLAYILGILAGLPIEAVGFIAGIPLIVAVLRSWKGDARRSTGLARGVIAGTAGWIGGMAVALVFASVVGAVIVAVANA